jgi:DNA-binding transcriptional LysR family regulator
MAPETLARAEPEHRGQNILSPPGAGPGYPPAEIEFRHLRYFSVVAEELHFGRAAARLYITQPGLSQAIARLERELQVRLFTRTRSNVELTEAGAELLHRGRRLLADLDETVARVRMAGRGQAGLVRVGVAHLAEPAIAPALAAFHAEYPSIVVDRSAMVSERLLEQLAEGRLHAAVIHQVPALATVDGVISDQTFLVNPRTLAPGAFEGLKLMCREFGGFEPNVAESALASTLVLGTDWRPIRDGTAIAVMPETTARVLRADGIAVVPVQPPPQYVLALAWRRDEQAAAARRFLTYLRCYRDQHAWITNGESASLIQIGSASLVVNAAEPFMSQAGMTTNSESHRQATQCARTQCGDPVPFSTAMALSLLL